jgi:DNA repair ATPase RecN
MNPSEVIGKTYVLDAKHFITQRDILEKEDTALREMLKELDWYWVVTPEITKLSILLNKGASQATQFTDLHKATFTVLETTELDNKPAYLVEIKSAFVYEDEEIIDKVPAFMEYLDRDEVLQTFLDSCLTVLIKYGLIYLDPGSQEDHTGMVFNPFTNTWSFGFTM